MACAAASLEQAAIACYDLSLQALAMQRFEPKRISINKKRHYINEGFPNVPEGIVLPSMTTVLSSMASASKIAALMNWRKKVGQEEANRRTRLAAERGTWLHGILEDWSDGSDIENHLSSMPQWTPYFTSIEPFLDCIAESLLVESAVAWFDPVQHIGVSGTQDQLVRMKNGAVALVDWKTSYKEKPDYQLSGYKKQLGGYSLALEQMYDLSIDEAWCVISCFDPEKEDSEPSLQLVHLDDFELVAEQSVLRDTVRRYFARHYPGGRAFALTADRG